MGYMLPIPGPFKKREARASPIMVENPVPSFSNPGCLLHSFTARAATPSLLPASFQHVNYSSQSYRSAIGQNYIAGWHQQILNLRHPHKGASYNAHPPGQYKLIEICHFINRKWYAQIPLFQWRFPNTLIQTHNGLGKSKFVNYRKIDFKPFHMMRHKIQNWLQTNNR